MRLNFASKPFTKYFPPDLKGHNVFIYRFTSMIFGILKVAIKVFLNIEKYPASMFVLLT